MIDPVAEGVLGALGGTRYVKPTSDMTDEEKLSHYREPHLFDKLYKNNGAFACPIKDFEERYKGNPPKMMRQAEVVHYNYHDKEEIAARLNLRIDHVHVRTSDY